MAASPDTVTAELSLSFVMPDDASLPVLVALRYDASDPYAVSVTFHTGVEESVSWTFARLLLTQGLNGPVGEGDVQVWPAHSQRRPVICLALSSPSGRALFEADLAGVVSFLERTYAVVPTGTEGEHVDLDAELALLLWSGRG